MKRLAWIAEIEHDGSDRQYRLGNAPPMCTLAVVAAICDAAHLDGFAYASVGRLVAETGVRADIVETIIQDLLDVGLVKCRYNAYGTRLLEPAAQLRPMYRLLGGLDDGSHQDAAA